MNKPKVLVTGANGFVGQALVQHLQGQGFDVVPGVRTFCPEYPDALVLGDIEKPIELPKDFQVDVVVHCAARAHRIHETTEHPEQAYFQANVQGLQHVFEATKACGLKRFIFFSTIKVLGERTHSSPFSETSPPNPLDHYAQSKLQAENWLKENAKGVEYVIIRPPLILGPQAKGNIKRLISWLAKGLPLPLKGIKNKRSMVHLSSLCSFTELTLTEPDAANEVFCIADDAFSTPEWVRNMAIKAQLKPTLVYCPVWILKLAALITNKRDMISKLVDSLEVDASKSKALIRRATAANP